METTTETLSTVVERQMVVPAWLRRMVEEHGPEATVRVTTRHTPFGSFLMGAEAV